MSTSESGELADLVASLENITGRLSQLKNRYDHRESLTQRETSTKTSSPIYEEIQRRLRLGGAIPKTAVQPERRKSETISSFDQNSQKSSIQEKPTVDPFQGENPELEKLRQELAQSKIEIVSLQRQLVQQEERIRQQDIELFQWRERSQQQEQLILDRETRIRLQEQVFLDQQTRDQLILDQETRIRQQEQEILDQHQTIQQQKQELIQYEQKIQDQNQQILQKQETIQKQNDESRQLRNQSRQNEEKIRQQEEQLTEQNRTLEKLRQQRNTIDRQQKFRVIPTELPRDLQNPGVICRNVVCQQRDHDWTWCQTVRCNNCEQFGHIGRNCGLAWRTEKMWIQQHYDYALSRRMSYEEVLEQRGSARSSASFEDKDPGQAGGEEFRN